MANGEAVDRISSLPIHVIHHILVRLPIGDAVRTSILSRNWRYSWSCMPELAFFLDCFPTRIWESQSEYERRVMQIVDHVLFLHCGPVVVFRLSVNVVSALCVDRWILFLSRNGGVEGITLEKRHGSMFLLPSCIFSFEALTFLNLTGCCFPDPPPGFKGFQRIGRISLVRVKITSDAGLEALIRSCPILDTLWLEDLPGCKALNIHSSTLKELTVKAEHLVLSINHVPRLVALAVGGVHEATDYRYPANKKAAVGRLLNHPIQISSPMKKLQSVSVAIDLNAMQEVAGAMLLFVTCPVLSTLKIQAVSSDNITGDETTPRAEDNFWNIFKSALRSLKFIQVSDMKGSRAELMFLRLVLASAPVLQTMQLQLEYVAHGRESVLKQIIQFRRISALAEIMIL